MRTRLTWVRTASEKEAAPASGLYGYTKTLEKSITASIRKIQKRAAKIAKKLYAKDKTTATFLSVHAKRSKSAAANILIEAMRAELTPKFAAEVNASYGMYGHRQKTAQLCLGACSELKQFTGTVAADLHRRKAAKYAKVIGFLKSHKKEAGCNCSNMLLSYYPEERMKFASVDLEEVQFWTTIVDRFDEVLPVYKASSWEKVRDTLQAMEIPKEVACRIATDYGNYREDLTSKEATVSKVISFLKAFKKASQQEKVASATPTSVEDWLRWEEW